MASSTEAFDSELLSQNTLNFEAQPQVALFVSGGIAVYKACEVLRNLQKAGCDVRVCMSEAATKMVGPQTFEALSGHHVLLDVFGDQVSPIPHIELAEWADIALVCPATANTLAKMACGIADNALSSTLLACTCPVVVAPAMNVHMWQNAATQANVSLLKERGIVFAGPAMGRLACGDTGFGKLAQPEQISNLVLAELLSSEKDLVGKSVVITAGPTHEAIDPVRYLANASSGKMGYALACAAAAHGAYVTLISGPSELLDPAGVKVVRVTSAQEMFEATKDAFTSADATILAAAVADYRPTTVSNHKMKKDSEPLDELKLTENTDILATLSATKGSRVVIGFAAETNDLVSHAQAKLERKGCDMIIANDVSASDSTFGSDTDAIVFVDAEGAVGLPCMPKREAAEAIVSQLALMLGDRD